MSIKRRKAKFLGALVVAATLSSTTALAATNYNYGPFTIDVENQAYTSTKTKQTETAAYVDQSRCRNSVLVCRIYNSGVAPKSATVKLTGIDNGRMSYSGYGVDEGDVLRMMIKNTSASGGIVTVSGQWRP